MKEISRHKALLLILVALVAASCTGEYSDGTGGDWGTWKTNTMVYVDLAPYDIEVDICDPSSVGVIANIATEKINESLPDNVLKMEGYSIKFIAADTDSPPIQGATYATSNWLPDYYIPLFFISPEIKTALLNDLNSGAYPLSPEYPAYAATYTIYGTDTLNNIPEVWGAVSSFSFMMGRYTQCELIVSPLAYSVIGVKNPDLDAADDITFYVSGGRAPYTVTSSSPIVVAPGTLPLGEFSFTVDPDSVTVTTEVILTVVDADAQPVALTVTINPP